MKLEDKVAIVTAAGRGLGRGIALALAKEGADVVVNSYREETTEAVADEIKAMSRRCLAIPGDITKPEKIIQVLDETIDTFGRMDILVNNVGSGSKTPKEPGGGPLGQIIATWDTTYEQNLRATVLMCEAVSPHFIEKGDGKIVNISSIAGRYAASVNVLENIARAVVFLASEDSKNITGQSINVDGGMIKT
jgi:NAD(P)-dependent dehydrogenase (short-subunit alcohol dehydrogenase family)